MSEEASEPSPGKSGFMVSPTYVGVALSVIALSGLGALIVVVSIGEADTLSTVALTLAMMSFGAQLAVSIAQFHQQQVQSAQVDRVNSETRSLLSQITAQATSLLTNQEQQFNRVLEYALRDAIPTAVDDASGIEGPVSPSLTDRNSVEFDADAFAASLRASIRQAFADVAPEAVRRASAREAPSTLSTNQYEAFVKSLSTFPTEGEGRAAAKILLSLTPWAAAQLTRIASDDISRARRGVAPQVAISNEGFGPATSELLKHGLIELRDLGGKGNGPQFRSLTPLGIDVARLIFASRSGWPDWLREEMTSGSLAHTAAKD